MAISKGCGLGRGLALLLCGRIHPERRKKTQGAMELRHDNEHPASTGKVTHCSARSELLCYMLTDKPQASQLLPASSTSREHRVPPPFKAEGPAPTQSPPHLVSTV